MSEISRSVLFGKMDSLLFTSLESATAFCKLRGNPYVELVHWLHQLMQSQNGDLQQIIRYFSLNETQLSQNIIEALDRLPRGASSVSDMSEHIDSAVERAWVYGSLKFGANQIRTGHLIIGMLKTYNLRQLLKSISAQFNAINAELLTDQFMTIVANSSENTLAQDESESSVSPVPSASGSVLAQYAQNMTERARKGEIDPVSGRDEEIRQLIDILMRRQQNNPLLTGEAGVGKTAVVEGLALRIATGDVPPQLREVQLCLLDLGILQAGAGVKGEFEKRLQALITEVQSSPTPIVLFIDEIHTLIGAGGTEGTGDAANLLKPALARGQLRTIGATTWSEYKKYIEKDPALTRRFQLVQIHEPSEEKALLMLRSTVSPLEQHHHVLLLDEAVDAAVRLSHRYIPARQLPDKAVALLDTACARVAVSQHAEPAQVEDCRHRIEALHIELGIASREAQIGIGNLQRPAEIEAQLAELAEQLAQLIERWQQELGLIQQIIDLRAQLHRQQNQLTESAFAESYPEDVAVCEEELRGKLAETQKQLDELQGESPLIFAAVDANIVAAVISDWTGIPLGRMVKNEIEAVLQLSDTLNQRIIGQSHALELISQRVRTSRARLDDPNKPVGVFLLAGPSGVGKTETALALAETLYGGEQNVITINMSEFQEAHTVSTLKGAPPGYVGFGEGGRLTEAVRRRPYSVVLLDEIEKAHPDVHEIFFQVFDKGWMEDGEGRRIDFRNTIIILTSNIGSELIASLCADPDVLPEPEALGTALRPPLLSVFPAALLGRLLVVPYYPLTDATLSNIVHLQLGRIQHRLTVNHGITCTFDDSVVKQIVSRCTEVESGGRMIDAILTNTLLPQISSTLLVANANAQSYRQLHISLQSNEFNCQFQA
ncbi:type VI secretion system ATPase TssH [Serratia sp. 2723]|uniref:type VI secretion system ATPase TssH n=1 Tax=unclassified Serratia (in: enterobacteria) TaxID=2647522 RepID=UPI003D1E58C5